MLREIREMFCRAWACRDELLSRTILDLDLHLGLGGVVSVVVCVR